MKSIRRAHVVMVAESDHGQMLAARLSRMDLVRVTAVMAFDEARRLCRAGKVDACVVACDEPGPDAPPQAEPDAPGRDCGVPSLRVVPAMTPYLRQSARRAGYAGAVPADIPARMLYRRIGAALQKRRAVRRGRRRLPKGWMPLSPAFGDAKPTLH